MSNDNGPYPCAACGSMRCHGRWHPFLLCYVRTVRLMRRNGGFYAYEEELWNSLPPNQRAVFLPPANDR